MRYSIIASTPPVAFDQRRRNRDPAKKTIAKLSIFLDEAEVAHIYSASAKRGNLVRYAFVDGNFTVAVAMESWRGKTMTAVLAPSSKERFRFGMGLHKGSAIAAILTKMTLPVHGVQMCVNNGIPFISAPIDSFLPPEEYRRAYEPPKEHLPSPVRIIKAPDAHEELRQALNALNGALANVRSARPYIRDDGSVGVRIVVETDL